MFLFNWVTSVANTQIEDVHENVPTAPKITINMKEHFETDALVGNGLSGPRPDKPLDFEKEHSSIPKSDTVVPETLMQNGGLVPAVLRDYTHDNVHQMPGTGQYMKDHIQLRDHEVILADTIDDLQKRVKDLEVTVASLIRKIQLPTSTIVEQEKIPVTPTGSPVDVPTFTNTVILADEKNMAKPKKINGIMLDAFQAELTSKLEKIRCNMGASQNMSR